MIKTNKEESDRQERIQEIYKNLHIENDKLKVSFDHGVIDREEYDELYNDLVNKMYMELREVDGA